MGVLPWSPVPVPVYRFGGKDKRLEEFLGRRGKPASEIRHAGPEDSPCGDEGAAPEDTEQRDW